MDESEPLRNYALIREELICYDASLELRPEIIVMSKAELPGADEVRQHMSVSLKKDVIAVSAVTGQGLDRLLRMVVALIDDDTP